ncbi:single-stranded-DNA-specific exonuclease RecJ [Rufibacter glacialis]|uniref:Single-stranded-DNA-specific exonuclease RecJ n=1 Tax=Rufibacter glacialis TaxID=1259555 RepID=A0A5M8QF71_9BACT|nr:single-stranded-DNA-specific exonuclease RecJ [Rufibacter glacialis]KAA6433604.1 single-stranded-DNA-specific exonuclease RecJ [Rufibacter glacialis]GGK73434.1 single-stranded-DNA-specific exonuclease RecJ [Rufibacter glacialis]
MQKRWVVKEAPDAAKVQNLADSLNIGSTLASILCQREIGTFDKAKAFFRPSLHDLHDPFLLKDMDKAVNRLLEALHGEERILIYGDYDVDGTTSVALVYGFLQRFFQGRIEYYIPDRYAEGYGISFQGIDWAQENGYSLIISLDCGVKSIDKIAYANTKGIDFIICDHHLPDEELPQAVAVLDAKRSDCPYPYKELAGCGVGFKFMQAFCQQLGVDEEPLFQLLDLVVVSIAADIVPITGENRILAYHGLQRLNNGVLRPGLQALKELAELRSEMDITQIVFGFAPRINAAGRMGDAKRSVAMLLAQTKEEAFDMVQKINVSNSERRGHDTSITKEALLMIEEDDFLRNARSTVLFKENWHKGVVGIVASRCIEKYYRPTIILTESNGKATGSARSVHGFDVHQAIVACSDLLDQFGGHMYAAGLTLPVENVPAFRERFEQIVASTILEEQLVPMVEIDTPLEFHQISQKFFNILKQMEPFGPGNMAPVFMSTCVYDTGSARVVGDAHLKLRLTQDGETFFDAIAFGMAEYYPRIQKGIPFDVCYCLEENVFRGNVSLQLRIKDIRFA